MKEQIRTVLQKNASIRFLSYQRRERQWKGVYRIKKLQAIRDLKMITKAIMSLETMSNDMANYVPTDINLWHEKVRKAATRQEESEST